MDTVTIQASLQQQRLQSWLPDSEYSEGTVLHAQCKLGTIVVEAQTANSFFHVTASNKCVIHQTPQSIKP